MSVHRVIFLCEEPKTRYVFPAAYTLQTCGREVYIVHDINECISVLNQFTYDILSKIDIVIPLVREFNYSAYGWTKIRKPKIVGLNLYNLMFTHLRKDHNNEVCNSDIYVIKSSDPMEQQLPDLIDRLNTITQLESINKCTIADSYMDATDKIILKSNRARLKEAETQLANEGGVAADIYGNEVYYEQGPYGEHNLDIHSTPEPVRQLPLTNLACVQRIVFVRHAQRLDELHPHWAEVAERPQDTPITEMGMLQSAYVGNWMNAQPWAHEISGVYSSPFFRTVHTAHLMLNSMKNIKRKHHHTGELKPDWSPRFPQAVDNVSDTAVSEFDMQINIENGLADEADWMAVNARPTKPWFLKPGDLYVCSPRIDLTYKSVKTPQFIDGDEYPGRPVEKEEVYDRCAVTIWRLALSHGMRIHAKASTINNNSSTSTGTIVVVSHAGPIMNMIHALCGVGCTESLEHTSITSCLFDASTGAYKLEQNEQNRVLLCSVEHLPNHLRS